MLTIFACPKSFTDPHIAIIQRNAITSWTLLEPRLEIILFGGEPYEFGVAEICQELGLRHVPEVERNQYGTPLLSDLFLKAEQLASHDLLAYVNADIVLMDDFMEAVKRVAELDGNFLLVGRRWDLDVRERLNFHPGWQEQLRSRARQEGRLHPPTGIDYFVYRRGFLGTVPPFVVGRCGFDNWLLFRARKLGAKVIDATLVVMAIHQNHEYSGLREPEHRQNLELVGGSSQLGDVNDATHRLTPEGVKLWIPGVLRLHRVWVRLLSVTWPVRRRLGLRRKTFQRWMSSLSRIISR